MTNVAAKSMADAWAPRLLSILRIVVALLFLAHGLVKLFGSRSARSRGRCRL